MEAVQRNARRKSLGAWPVEDVSIFCFEGVRFSSTAASSVPRIRAIAVRILRCAPCEAPRILPTHLPAFPDRPSCLVPFDARSERECRSTRQQCQRQFAHPAKKF
jgi:hypothetical protein